MEICVSEVSFRSSADMLDAELHALAQPLTSLQCRLEIGCLAGEQEFGLSTLQDSLLELKRVFAAVERMREVIGMLSVLEKGGHVR